MNTKTIEIAGKKYPFFVSISVAEQYYESLQRLQDKEKTDRAYRELMIETIRDGISAGHYLQGGWRRLFRFIICPSAEHLFNVMTFKEMAEKVHIAFGTGVTPEAAEEEGEAEGTKKK